MRAARGVASGFRFAGPQFYVFDEDVREARAWATELAALAPGPDELHEQPARTGRGAREARRGLRERR